jgi:predicted RNA binding protein YcfA (HicA-like mRNA interferase family)
VIRILEEFGFVVASQRGSHIKLQRAIQGERRETLIVPNHGELDEGTCRAIFRQACAYIPESELGPHFMAP